MGLAQARDNRNEPANDFYNVTPDDGADLPIIAAALIIGTSGTLHCITVAGQERTLPAMPNGFVLQCGIRQVFTDSGASHIVALV